MEYKYIVKNGIHPFAKGASKMVFQARIVDDALKQQIEQVNDGLFIKRLDALKAWKYKNSAQIMQKLGEITDLDKQLEFMKNIDAIADKMDGSEQCFFPADIVSGLNVKKTVIVQIPVKTTDSLKHLRREIELQHTLSEKNMMPKIYAIQLFVKTRADEYAFFEDAIETFLTYASFETYIGDNDGSSIKCIYLLEEKCDSYEPEDITINAAANYVNQVAKLAKATADLGYYNTDFKHGNECPTTETINETLNLVNLRGLDFDPNMLIEIPDAQKDDAAALMFAVYLIHFSVKRDFYFEENIDVLEKILEHGREKLATMNYADKDKWIQVINAFGAAYSKIILASYLTATGDKDSIMYYRKNVPTLLLQHILQLLNIKREDSVLGTKRKIE